MRVKPIVARVKGFYRVADYALRWGMIAPDAHRRLQILDFWRRHGLDATREAFKVSRRTLFGWRAKLKAEGGNLAALVPRSTAPKRRRQRQWPPALLEEIRRLRTLYPNLGKEKLHLLLKPFANTHQLACRVRAPSAGSSPMPPTRCAAGHAALAPPAKPSPCANPACVSPSTSRHCVPATAWRSTASSCAPRASGAS
jgi:hypothetical protein